MDGRPRNTTHSPRVIHRWFSANLERLTANWRVASAVGQVFFSLRELSKFTDIYIQSCLLNAELRGRPARHVRSICASAELLGLQFKNLAALQTDRVEFQGKLRLVCIRRFELARR